MPGNDKINELLTQPLSYEERVAYARAHAMNILKDIDQELQEHKDRISRAWSRPSINDPRYKEKSNQ